MRPKQYLYSTAFSPMYNTYVGIVRVIERGGMFYYWCRVLGIEDRLIQFKESELTQFVL